jgi:hypothetical protein
MTKVVNNSPSASSETLEAVLTRALQGLHYGSVEIVIHDAKVVQIERKEKLRLGEPFKTQQQSAD